MGRPQGGVAPQLVHPSSILPPPKATDFLPILGDSPVAILHQRAESWGTCRRVGRERDPTWSSRGRRWVERRSCGTRRRSCRCVLFLAQGVPLVDPRNTVTHNLTRPDVSSCDLDPSTARYSRRHDGLRPARDPAAESGHRRVADPTGPTHILAQVAEHVGADPERSPHRRHGGGRSFRWLEFRRRSCCRTFAGRLAW